MKSHISRTQSKKGRKAKSGAMITAAPLTWAGGNGGTELKTYYANSGNYQLYHNVAVNYFNTGSLLDAITQGVGVTNRIGNRIFVRRLRMNLVLNNKTDRPNVSYRVSVCAAPSTTATDSYGELFTGGGFTSLHAVTNSLLLHDVTFPLNQGSGMENNITPNKERSFTHQVVVDINRPVVYSTADNACSTRLIAFVVAYDAYGTLITDNIASIAQTSWAVDFTDD